MGHLFRVIMLIWSYGQEDPFEFSLLIIPVISLYVGGFKSNTFYRQGDPFEFSLLIIPVISLYVGGFKSNTFKGSFIIFFHPSWKFFTFSPFLLRVKVFLKNK